MSDTRPTTEIPEPDPPRAMPAQAAPAPAAAPAPRDAVDRLADFLPGSDAWAAALEPSNAPSAWKIAERLFDARLFAMANVSQVFAAIMLGRSLGLGAMTILRSVHMVKGKLTLHVDLMVGLVRRSPLCEWWTVIETTADRCTIETQRRGSPKATRHTVTLDDAITAGLVPRNGGGTDSTWGKHRRQMLRHFAERELARMEYQDIVGGLYTPEELTDYADVPSGERAA